MTALADPELYRVVFSVSFVLVGVQLDVCKQVQKNLLIKRLHCDHQCHYLAIIL